MAKVPKPKVTNIDMSKVPLKNYGEKRPASQVKQVTFHHIVGSAAAGIAEMKKVSRTMSFNYCIGSDGRIYEACGVGTVAYCDTNLASNRRTISIEHAGGGGGVSYTDKMYAASARLNAWLIDSLGIKSFKLHRDVADPRWPTACPGKLDTKRILKEANKIIASYKEDDLYKGKSAKHWYTVVRRRGDMIDRIASALKVKFARNSKYPEKESASVDKMVARVKELQKPGPTEQQVKDTLFDKLKGIFGK